MLSKIFEFYYYNNSDDFKKYLDDFMDVYCTYIVYTQCIYLSCLYFVEIRPCT